MTIFLGPTSPTSYCLEVLECTKKWSLYWRLKSFSEIVIIIPLGDEKALAEQSDSLQPRSISATMPKLGRDVFDKSVTRAAGKECQQTSCPWRRVINRLFCLLLTTIPGKRLGFLNHSRLGFVACNVKEVTNCTAVWKEILDTWPAEFLRGSRGFSGVGRETWGALWSLVLVLAATRLLRPDFSGLRTHPEMETKHRQKWPWNKTKNIH